MLMRVIEVPNVLTSKECEKISNYCSSKCKASTVGEGHLDVNVRNSRNCFLTPQDKSISDLINKVIKAFVQVSAEAFDFPIAIIDEIQYAEYIEGMFYDYHIDAGDTPQYDRDLSASFILSSSKDYTGGDLTFDTIAGIQTPECDKGDLVIFPSTLSHKVDKVLSGKRSSLVIWGRRPQLQPQNSKINLQKKGFGK
tara:strand:- start:148 stop:735 length:588 start_codon:yes stop_codon:yes gene_type:complete